MAEIRRYVDGGVRALVFDVDSPGGMVVGTKELANTIRSLEIPTCAAVGSQCASAAYWVAAACDEIVALSSSYVGSVGAYAVHYDYSGLLTEAGVVATVIEAGEGKTEGSNLKPLSEEARSHVQRQINSVYASFVSSVSKDRNVSKDEIVSGWGARTYLAEEAVKMSMIDRVATIDDVVAKFSSARRRMASRQRAMARARAGGVG